MTLRLEDGEELPFMIDTGASGTIFDKSLEPKLGKRLGTETTAGWSGKGGKANLYAAPKLYLGNTRLITGSKVSTGSAILGMDCLKHYCIQFDFEAGKMHFLNPDQVNTAGLGKAYPLTFKWNVPFIHHVGLLGGSDTNLLIDMGCRTDGLAGKSEIHGLVQFLPDCVWDGDTYSNLAVAAVGNANVLGLNFFARHLVTLDFPKRMMYLKQTSIGPLASDSSIKTSNDEIEAPVKFLKDLKENGQLSGLSKNDETAIYLEAYSNFESQSADSKSVAYVRAYFNSRHKSATFGFWKKDDSSIYHYTVARSSENSSWKLQKAWRTDQSEK
ncbi:MAG TPA: retropepsin-like aspartic protease [Verrucomicrobiae bacterium]